MGLTFNQCTHSLSHLSKKNTTPVSQEAVCVCTCVRDGPCGGAPAVDLLHPTITTHRWQEFQKWGKRLRPTRSPSSHKNTWIGWISWISWLSLSCVIPHLTLQGPPVILCYSFLFEMTSVVHAGSGEVPYCVRLGQDAGCKAAAVLFVQILFISKFDIWWNKHPLFLFCQTQHCKLTDCLQSVSWV